MNKYFWIFLGSVLLLCAALWRQNTTLRADRERLQEQQEWLADQLDRTQGLAASRADSNRILRMRCNEFERLKAADARRIRDLGIRLRRLEALGTAVSVQHLTVEAPLCDTVIRQAAEPQPIADTARLFRWHDPWCRIEGRILADTVICRMESIDTLRQIVHRVPHRFLFFRWGTKYIRQEIVSSNPHTRIVYSELIRLEK